MAKKGKWRTGASVSQATPHKRGGTHRVKDADLTGTEYDNWNYARLKKEAEVRKIYIKDMKKVAMAHALAEFDADAKNEQRKALRIQEELIRQRARQKKIDDDREMRARVAKRKRKIEKQMRRDREESVSDDTPDEEELQMMHNEMLGIEDNVQALVGQALSDESWDSTSTESSVRSKAQSIGPGYKLRLFEWSYLTMPSPAAPTTPALTADGTPVEPVRVTRSPASIPYISLKMHTTETEEKLFLPGQIYPQKVPQDYVPVLTQEIRDAVRNGVLLGVLRKATIEPADLWTKRTRVQGWNALMFFALPPRNKAKNLVDVYNKWNLENRRLLRVKPMGDGEKMSRAKRHEQRHRNKAKRYAEVLEASEYRPKAICYLPAYLDYDADKTAMKRRERKERRALDNLFYIRFPGCDVPHYYFWSRKGEWANPNVPNPFYDPQDVDTDDVSSGFDFDSNRPPIAEKRLPELPQTYLKRVRNSIQSHLPPMAHPPNLANATARIECLLHTRTLAEVLSFYRNQWLSNGKEHLWREFGYALPVLCPSGEFPAAPPVEPTGMFSLAEKLAGIEIEGEDSQLTPIQGGEAWTRDDDKWWDVVQGDEESLYRRSSTPTPLFMPDWLDQIGPSYVPLTPDPVPPTPSISRSVWDAQYLQPGLKVLCPFCEGDIGPPRNLQQQAEHYLGHGAGPRTGARSRKEEGMGMGMGLFGGGTGRDKERWLSEATICPVNSVSRRGTTARVSFCVSEDEEKDGDDEKTQVNQPRPRPHVSQESYSHPSTPSSHIPSLYLPTVRRLPPQHPNAAFTPRKRSVSTMGGSSEFLPKTKRQRIPEVNVEYGLGRNGREEVFYSLARRQSDATYQPPPSARVPSRRKRRRVLDPTYREGRANKGVEEGDVPVVKEKYGSNGNVKKRKKPIVDQTYRPEAKKWDGVDIGTLRVTRLKRRRKSVDLSGEYGGDELAGLVSGDGSRSGGAGGNEIWANEVEEGWWAWSGVGEWCRVM